MGDKQEQLAIACVNGDVVSVELVLKTSDFEQIHSSTLVSAIIADRYNVVKLLLNDSRMDPTLNDNAAVRHAVYLDHSKIVELLKMHPKIDKNIVSEIEWNSEYNI